MKRSLFSLIRLVLLGAAGVSLGSQLFGAKTPPSKTVTVTLSVAPSADHSTVLAPRGKAWDNCYRPHRATLIAFGSRTAHSN